MQTIYTDLSQKPGIELFFGAWVTMAIALIAYTAIASLFVSDITTALWLIGAPIAFAKAAFVLSGLGALTWLTVPRRL